MNQFTLSNLPDGKELTFVRTREPLFNPNQTIDYLTYQRFVTDTGEQYYYVPQEFVAKGLTQQTQDGKTFVVAKPSLLNKDILNKAIPVVIPQNALGTGSGELEGALGQYANLYEKPTTGFLFKGDEDVIKAFSTKPSFWNVGDSVQKEGGGTSAEFSGKIVGIGEKDGQYVYLQEPREGVSSSYLTSSGTHKTYTEPSRPGGLLGTLSDFIADTPFLPEIVGIIAAANPATAPFATEIYAASKGIQTASRGGEIDDVLKSIATSYAGAKVTAAAVKGISPDASGVYGGEVEVQPGGFYGEMPTAPSVPGVDYSLIGGTNFPPPAEGMGGGTGITPGAPGVGLQQPTMPNIAGMGGGQGLIVPVDGGSVGQLGFTPAGAVPVLGDPKSFINNPDVLGQPVIQQGSPEPFLSVRDALRGLNLASQLGAPQQQLPTQPIGEQATPATGVDYSGLLGLLATRSGGSGLLGTRFQPQPINLTSLLG